jgi:hypothetical protein
MVRVFLLSLTAILVSCGGNSLDVENPKSASESGSERQVLSEISDTQMGSVIGKKVKTIAGGTTSGYIDGPGKKAQFNENLGITLSPDGSVLVADAVNCAIRKVTRSGFVSTFVGNGTCSWSDDYGVGINSPFVQPLRLTTDKHGNTYVPIQYTIVSVSPDGNWRKFSLFVATDPSDLAGPPLPYSTYFYSPSGFTPIAVNGEGVIYIAGFSQSEAKLVVSKIYPTGATITNFYDVGSPCFDGQGNYCSDYNSLWPSGIAVADDGEVFVSLERRIYKIRLDGDLVLITGQQSGLTLDSSGSAAIIDGPSSRASFKRIQNITIDAYKNIYLSDYTVLRVLGNDGYVSRLAGSDLISEITSIPVDGPALEARFCGPYGLVFDKEKNYLYVSDYCQRAIRRLDIDYRSARKN